MAYVGFGVGMELGERREIINLKQLCRRNVHAVEIERGGSRPRQTGCEGSTPAVDVVMICALHGVKPRVGVGMYGMNPAYGYVRPENRVEGAHKARIVVDTKRKVGMGHHHRGVDACICAPGPNHGHRRTEHCGKSLLHALLHAYITRLNLPAVEPRAEIRQVDEMSGGSFHGKVCMLLEIRNIPVSLFPDTYSRRGPSGSCSGTRGPPRGLSCHPSWPW